MFLAYFSPIPGNPFSVDTQQQVRASFERIVAPLPRDAKK